MYMENTELWNKCQCHHDPTKQQNTKSHIENAKCSLSIVMNGLHLAKLKRDTGVD